MRNNIVWLGLFVLGAGCSTAATAEPVPVERETPAAVPAQQAPPIAAVDVPSAQEGTAPEPGAGSLGVEVRGTALAVRESYLSAAVPGIIKRITVERGEHVKKNQPLVELDSRGFRLGVQQASAALDGALAQEEQVRTEIARVEELLKSGAVPTATLDQLTAQKKGTAASVRMARAGLGQAKKAQADAVVRAPYDGVISEILKQQGENAPAMPPTMLIKIVDTSSLEVQAFVPEDAAGRIVVGDTARVRIDSVDADMVGEIVFVSNAIAPGVRTFEVRVKLDNPEGKIKAGAFARVLFADQPAGSRK